MYYVVDIEEDWYIKGSKDHYKMSYTGDLDKERLGYLNLALQSKHTTKL